MLGFVFLFSQEFVSCYFSLSTTSLRAGGVDFLFIVIKGFLCRVSDQKFLSLRHPFFFAILMRYQFYGILNIIS